MQPTQVAPPTTCRLATMPHNWHSRSMIFIPSDRTYDTPYSWLIVILAVSLAVSEIWPVFHWISPHSIQSSVWKCFPCTILLKFCMFRHMANYCCKKFSPTT